MESAPRGQPAGARFLRRRDTAGRDFGLEAPTPVGDQTAVHGLGGRAYGHGPMRVVRERIGDRERNAGTCVRLSNAAVPRLAPRDSRAFTTRDP